jgi:hypothetical protein
MSRLASTPFGPVIWTASHPNVLNADSDALVQWPLAPRPAGAPVPGRSKVRIPAEPGKT